MKKQLFFGCFWLKNMLNHWLLSLSVRFCPNPQATPYRPEIRRTFPVIFVPVPGQLPHACICAVVEIHLHVKPIIRAD